MNVSDGEFRSTTGRVGKIPSIIFCESKYCSKYFCRGRGIGYYPHDRVSTAVNTSVNTFKIFLPTLTNGNDRLESINGDPRRTLISNGERIMGYKEGKIKKKRMRNKERKKESW